MPELTPKTPKRDPRLSRFIYDESDLVQIFVDSSLSSEKKSANVQKKSDTSKKKLNKS